MDDSETGRRAVAGLAALRAELSAIRALLAERDARLEDLAGQLAERNAQLAGQDRRLAGQAERVRELEDEIRRLKKLPRRPDLKPKGSGAPDGDADGSPPGSSGSGDPERKKRRGRGPRRRNPNLRRREETAGLENVPEGAVRRGYQEYTVRDIVLYAEEVTYRCEVWEFPDGTRHVAPRPDAPGPGSAGTRPRARRQFPESCPYYVRDPPGVGRQRQEFAVGHLVWLVVQAADRNRNGAFQRTLRAAGSVPGAHGIAGQVDFPGTELRVVNEDVSVRQPLDPGRAVRHSAHPANSPAIVDRDKKSPPRQKPALRRRQIGRSSEGAAANAQESESAGHQVRIADVGPERRQF